MLFNGASTQCLCHRGNVGALLVATSSPCCPRKCKRPIGAVQGPVFASRSHPLWLRRAWFDQPRLASLNTADDLQPPDPSGLFRISRISRVAPLGHTHRKPQQSISARQVDTDCTGEGRSADGHRVKIEESHYLLDRAAVRRSQHAYRYRGRKGASF